MALNAPACEEDVNAFEEMHGILLPPDLRAYFLQLNGTQGMDSEYFTFRSLSQIVRCNEQELKDFFVIADFLIDSNVFAIQLGRDQSQPNAVYSISGGAQPLCNSFSEFVELVVRNDRRLN